MSYPVLRANSLGCRTIPLKFRCRLSFTLQDPPLILAPSAKTNQIVEKSLPVSGQVLQEFGAIDAEGWEKGGAQVLDKDVSRLHVDSLLQLHNFVHDLPGLRVGRVERGISEHLPADRVKALQDELIKSRNERRW